MYEPWHVCAIFSGAGFLSFSTANLLFVCPLWYVRTIILELVYFFVTNILSISLLSISLYAKAKQFLYRPGQALGLQEVEDPRFLVIRIINLVRLSALHTGRLYSPGNIPGTHFCWSTAVAQWLRCCAKSRKVAGSIPDGDIGIFYWHNPSDRTISLGSTQPLTEMSTRSIFWG